MDAEIELKEKKLIERYGKEKYERMLNRVYERTKGIASKKEARSNFILGHTKFLADSTPSTITDRKK